MVANSLMYPLAALSMLLPHDHTPTFRATVTGVVQANLSGSAVFGTTDPGRNRSGVFSLTLGAYSDQGAVVFSREILTRPAPGIYDVSESGDPGSRPEDFHALVILGSPEQPLGVFRAREGTVSVRRSSSGALTGQYEIRAIGFLAADPDDDDREIMVRGSFAATPSEPRPGFNASMRGAVQGTTSGGAEFGMVQNAEAPRFTIALGARDDSNAVVLTVEGAQPGVGTYEVGDGPQSPIHALIVSGAVDRPTGVFQSVRGRLTITRSDSERLIGSFEIEANGFLARHPTGEDRQVWVSGSFAARPSYRPLLATLSDAVPSGAERR